MAQGNAGLLAASVNGFLARRVASIDVSYRTLCACYFFIYSLLMLMWRHLSDSTRSLGCLVVKASGILVGMNRLEIINLLYVDFVSCYN